MKEIKQKDIKVLYTEACLQKGIKELADKLNDYYKNEEVCLICVLKGSVMFMTDLAKNLQMPLKMEFIRLSSYGSAMTSSGRVDAVDLNLPDLNNKNVIIVEDIVDTGLTAKYLLNYFNTNYKPKSLKFVSLLDKKIKREVDVNPDYYVLEVEDKFLIGYGLDYDGLFRNLPYIGYIEK